MMRQPASGVCLPAPTLPPLDACTCACRVPARWPVAWLTWWAAQPRQVTGSAPQGLLWLGGSQPLLCSILLAVDGRTALELQRMPGTPSSTSSPSLPALVQAAAASAKDVVVEAAGDAAQAVGRALGVATEHASVAAEETGAKTAAQTAADVAAPMAAAAASTAGGWAAVAAAAAGLLQLSGGCCCCHCCCCCSLTPLKSCSALNPAVDSVEVAAKKAGQAAHATAEAACVCQHSHWWRLGLHLTCWSDACSPKRRQSACPPPP